MKVRSALAQSIRDLLSPGDKSRCKLLCFPMILQGMTVSVRLLVVCTPAERAHAIIFHEEEQIHFARALQARVRHFACVYRSRSEISVTVHSVCRLCWC